MATGVSGTIGPFNIYRATKHPSYGNPSEGSNWYQLRILYSEDYDISTNRSTVTFKLQGTSNNPDNKGLNWGTMSNILEWVDGKITVDGTAIKTISAYAGDGSITFTTGQWTDYSGGTFSTTVTHATDGSKSITVGMTSNNMEYYGFCVGSGAGYYYYAPWGIGTKSQTIALTTIPRTSTMTVSNATMGGKATVTISAASSSFTHKVAVSCGTYSNSDIGTSWTVPDLSGYFTSSETSKTATYTLTTYSGSTAIGTYTTSATISMPGQATIGNITANLGTSPSVSVTKPLTSYKTSMQYKVGTSGWIACWSQQKDAPSTISVAESVGGYFPTAMKGTGTIELYTYRNSTSGYVVYGSAKTATITLNVPDYSPSVSFTTSKIVNSNATINGWGVAVKGYTTYQWAVSDSTRYGASISSRAFSCGGRTGSTASGTTAAFTSVGSTTPTMTITDSRGKTATAKATAFTIYDYASPTIISSYAYRTDSAGTKKDDGTYVTEFINAKTDYTCGGHNSISIRSRWKESSGSWSEWGWEAIANNTPKTSNNWTITKSYAVELEVIDSIGSEKSVVYTIPTASVAFNIKEGGKGAAFFGYAQTDGVLNVNGGLTTSGTIKQTNGNNHSLELYTHTNGTVGFFDRIASRWLLYTEGETSPIMRIPYPIFANGHSSAIGSYVVGTTSDTVAVASRSNTVVASVSITAGKWLAIGTWYVHDGTTRYMSIGIAATPFDITAGGNTTYKQADWAVITGARVLDVSNTTTINLYAWTPTAVSASACRGRIIALRVE